MTTTHAARLQLARLADEWAELNDAIVRRPAGPGDGIRTGPTSGALPYDERVATTIREVTDFAVRWTRACMDEVEVLETEWRTVVDPDTGETSAVAVQVPRLWSPPADQSVPSLLRTMARETVDHLLTRHPGWFDVELDELSWRLSKAIGPKPSREVVLVRSAQLVRRLRG